MKTYEVWVIRKQNTDGSYSYYSHTVNGFPEFVTGHSSREHCKHFKTESVAKRVLEMISVYITGLAEVIPVKTTTL